MESSKLTVTMVIFIVAGIIFLLLGFVFIREKWIDKLTESVCDEKKKNAAKKMAKTCSTISVVLGGWTIFTGITVLFLPQLFNDLSLIYLFVLIGSVSVLTFMIKTVNYDIK